MIGHRLFRIIIFKVKSSRVVGRHHYIDDFLDAYEAAVLVGFGKSGADFIPKMFRILSDIFLLYNIVVECFFLWL